METAIFGAQKEFSYIVSSELQRFLGKAMGEVIKAVESLSLNEYYSSFRLAPRSASQLSDVLLHAPLDSSLDYHHHKLTGPSEWRFSSSKHYIQAR
jgi:hypothetical protein